MVGKWKSGTSRGSESTRRRKREKQEKNNAEIPIINEPPQIQEGDIYYRTVRSYPSIPTIPDEVILTITKPLVPEPVPPVPEEVPVPVPVPGGRRSISDTLPVGRRVSVASNDKSREESSPPLNESDRSI